MKTQTIRSKVLEMYIDYVNNFLTVERFAEYYGISEDLVNAIIREGRELNEQVVTYSKSR